jgi:hypothetical protein
MIFYLQGNEWIIFISRSVNANEVNGLHGKVAKYRTQNESGMTDIAWLDIVGNIFNANCLVYTDYPRLDSSNIMVTGAGVSK